MAVRHGHEDGEVTLGGRRVEVQRPRVRSADGDAEVALQTYEHFADRDPGAVDVEGRRSRARLWSTREALGEVMGRRLSDLRLAVMMLDGLELKGRMMIVALGITTEGVKIPVGLWEGSTENATVATALLSDLVERGLGPEQGMLFVIDGSKALRKAVRSVFGEVPVQRCIRHSRMFRRQEAYQRPSALAASVWARPEGRIRPSTIRRSARSLLRVDQVDLGLLGW